MHEYFWKTQLDQLDPFLVTISTNQYILGFKAHAIHLFSQSVGYEIFHIYHVPGHFVSDRNTLVIRTTEYPLFTLLTYL